MVIFGQINSWNTIKNSKDILVTMEALNQEIDKSLNYEGKRSQKFLNKFVDVKSVYPVYKKDKQLGKTNVDEVEIEFNTFLSLFTGTDDYDWQITAFSYNTKTKKLKCLYEGDSKDMGEELDGQNCYQRFNVKGNAKKFILKKMVEAVKRDSRTIDKNNSEDLEKMVVNPMVIKSLSESIKECGKEQNKTEIKKFEPEIEEEGPEL